MYFFFWKIVILRLYIIEEESMLIFLSILDA